MEFHDFLADFCGYLLMFSVGLKDVAETRVFHEYLRLSYLWLLVLRLLRLFEVLTVFNNYSQFE